MSVTISDDTMTSDLTDTVATLIDPAAGWWTVTGRRGVYTRDQAITAMTIAEFQAHPHTDSEQFIAGWERELLVPVMPRDPWALLQTLKLAATALNEVPDRWSTDERSHKADLADFLRSIGYAALDLAAAADKVADIADERGCKTQVDDYFRAGRQALAAMGRLREAGSGLQIGAHDAQRAQIRQTADTQ